MVGSVGWLVESSYLYDDVSVGHEERDDTRLNRCHLVKVKFTDAVGSEWTARRRRAGD